MNPLPSEDLYRPTFDQSKAGPPPPLLHHHSSPYLSHGNASVYQMDYSGGVESNGNGSAGGPIRRVPIRHGSEAGLIGSVAPYNTYMRSGSVPGSSYAGSDRSSDAGDDAGSTASFYGGHHYAPSPAASQANTPFNFPPQQLGHTNIYGASVPPAQHDPHQQAQAAMPVITSSIFHNQQDLSREQIKMQLDELAVNVRNATTTSSSDRAKHIFVQSWLTAHYVENQDGSVPRQALYRSYSNVCDGYTISHVNTATLGKAIRLCFPQIKTRRLGVRGNSKYHYCGIKAKTKEERDWIEDYSRRTSNFNTKPGGEGSRPDSRGGSASATDESPDDEDDGDDGEMVASKTSLSQAPARNLSISSKREGSVAGPYLDDRTPTVNSGSFQQQQQQQSRRSSLVHPFPVVGSNIPVPRSGLPPGDIALGFLRPGQSVNQLAHFPSIAEAISPQDAPHQAGQSQEVNDVPGSFQDVARRFWADYESHLNDLLTCIRSYDFEQFGRIYETFWGPHVLGSNEGDWPQKREIAQAPSVAALISRADTIMFDEVFEILRSKLEQPIAHSTLTALRTLADRLERSIADAMEGVYLKTFKDPKVELAARVAHMFVRFNDLYQISQALSSVLSHPAQITDMLNSWRLVDFDSVRNQGALVCNCRHEDITQLLEYEFPALLERMLTTRSSVTQITNWSDQCCERLLKHGHNMLAMGSNHALQEQPGMPISARSLLIRWGYITGQIMRDLTIRSDASFGAFQILKLFVDDWIALNVLRQVALSGSGVAHSVDPSHYMTLSPGGAAYMGGSSGMGIGGMLSPNSALASYNANAAQLMAHTPTTASMLAAMGVVSQHDPFMGQQQPGVGAGGGGPSGYVYQPMTFGPGAASNGVSAGTGSGAAGADFGMDIAVSSPPHATSVSGESSEMDVSSTSPAPSQVQETQGVKQEGI